MRKSKVFLAFAIVFVIVMGIASYDFSRRTTHPGSKSQLMERIKKQLTKPDSVQKTPKK